MVLFNKRIKNKQISLCFLAALSFFVLVSSASIITSKLYAQAKAGQQDFYLKNDLIQLSIQFRDGELFSETLSTMTQGKNSESFCVETNADFNLDVMWTGWRPPGKDNNAENPVIFTKEDFVLIENEKHELNANDKQEIQFVFKGVNNRFFVKLTYQLGENDYYFKRKIAVRDTNFGKHFLRKFIARNDITPAGAEIVKKGGFGQPVALKYNGYGMFTGLEYPTSTNVAKIIQHGKTQIKCRQEIGEKIGREWLESDWVVLALTPDADVKKWFMKYVDDLRVAPLNPYTLYNSWYDLRAPEMVKDSSFIMNEENTLRIIKLFKENMIDKYGIHLNAFVLDDGWDVYRSDWALREKEYPNGLRPISDELKKIGTDLGIWFGPIGGYSHRDWRINWMEDHGYELVGTQLCLAGKNYKELFKKRVVDFVVNDNVGYYKWDGIQFSCSEENHGHQTGIYSRRAVMESVIEMCDAVREKNPDIFLNITSGTWLSPWWLKYTNQIWMQGYDYGYANVPSISRRDAAMTYRDFVLYEDFYKKELWFPIANLMTHGIIKGNLQKLGGEGEALDNFTNNALLYFARGVSMWELYISPDLLTHAEWQVLSESIRWAKDRFPILKNTEMIGGDPGERKTYGYAHFSGKKGIVAVRNPKIEPDVLKLKLSSALGICPKAASLVLERVYPTRWISPDLYSAGANIELQLDGFETAIYEIYPIEEAAEPLLAGIIFNSRLKNNDEVEMDVFNVKKIVRLLNPEIVQAAKLNGVEVELKKLTALGKEEKASLISRSVEVKTSRREVKINAALNVDNDMKNPVLALLLESDSHSEKFTPKIKATLNGKSTDLKIEQQKNRWVWYKMELNPGENKCQFRIQSSKKGSTLKSNGVLWLLGQLKHETTRINFELVSKTKERILPPKPWEDGFVRKNVKLKKFMVDLKK